MGPQAKLKKQFLSLRTKDVFRNELVPLFIICRFVGLFNYDRDMKISIRYTLAGLAVHILYSGIVVYVFILSSLIAYEHKLPYADIQVTTYGLCHGMNLILVAIHLVMMLMKRHTFQSIVDELLLMDAFWSKHSTLFSKAGTKIGIGVLILFYYTLPVFNGLIHRYVIFYITVLCLTEMFFFYITMQFCAILDIIRVHLKELREQMVSDEMHLMSSIAKHQTLLRFCPVVNDAYSWQILIMCFKFFVFSLMVAYLIILDNSGFLSNAIRLSIILWEFGLLFPIAWMCSDIEDEADNFNNKLFNLMRESKDLCSNDKLHLYVTMKQSVNFTACGFFTLGYPLVTSIIAAATTYLVILVQFSMTN